MNELLNYDIKTISEVKGAPMVSIYASKKSGILDTRSLNDLWKEILHKVESILLKDFTRTFVHSFLEPLAIDNLLAKCESIDKGIVIFYNSKFQGYVRVQTEIDDLIIVADSFHVKPLLRIKNNERGFVILTMSMKTIGLFTEKDGHLYKLKEFKNTAIDANVDVDTNKYPREHPKEFFSQMATELNKIVNSLQLPVILAGVKDHLGHMKKFLNSPLVVEGAIVGNVERLKINELRERAYNIVVPYYKLKEKESLVDLDKAINQNHAVTYIEDIALSAVQGKVKKLYVVENRHLWGRVNKITGEVFISPRQINSHEDDILDDLSQIVLLKGGDVVVIKNVENMKGYYAAAVVTDRSHLYDLNASTSLAH